MKRSALIHRVACVCAVLIGCIEVAAAAPDVSRAQFLSKVVTGHFVPRIAAFARTAPPLTKSMDALCDSPGPETLKAARAAWVDNMLAWEAANAIGFGPLIARRSALRIDFWPARQKLIDLALSKSTKTVKDLELVGAPGKGIAAIEWLLWTPADKPEILTDSKRCEYARLLALEVAEEALDLDAAFAEFASKGLPDDVNDDAFAALFNLAILGVEHLDYRKMEKPAETGNEKNFPRSLSGQTAAAWNAQWASLRHFFLDGGSDRNDSLEAFLRANDLAAAADKLRNAADKFTRALDGMQKVAPATAREAARQLSAVRTVLVADVAVGLKILANFGASDGD